MTDFDGIAKYALEVGVLKRSARTGWWIAGLSDVESVAEHSHRTAILGTIIASLEDADPARTALLCVLHDTSETRIGDIPHVGRRYLTAVANEDIVADQLSEVPDSVASVIAGAVGEFEANESLEARCAKDADKLECLIQAVEYRHAGATKVDDWINNSLKSLKTDSAIAIAEAVLDADPQAWQRTQRS